MKFGNEFGLILFWEYISPKLFAVHGNLLTPDDGDLVDLVDVPSAKELVGPVHKRIQVVEAHPRGLRSIHILPVPASVLQHPLSQGAHPQQSSDR
jgi:hypothetical protein